MGNDTGLSEALQFAADQALGLQNARDTHEGREYILIPGNMRVHEFAQANPPLWRIKANANFLDPKSFNQYVNEFKTEHTRLFGNPDSNSFLGIIDYHNPPNSASAQKSDYENKYGVATFCSHRVTYNAGYSESWKRWADIDGRSLAQKEFAEFIEENYLEIVKPDHAMLLSAISNLQAVRGVKFSAGTNLQNGDVQFSYQEETKQERGTLTLPKSFTVLMPVYEGGSPVTVTCLLRWGLSEGTLTFKIKIQRRKFLEREAFKSIATEIANVTKLAVYMGSFSFG